MLAHDGVSDWSDGHMTHQWRVAPELKKPSLYRDGMFAQPMEPG